MKELIFIKTLKNIQLNFNIGYYFIFKVEHVFQKIKILSLKVQKWCWQLIKMSVKQLSWLDQSDICQQLHLNHNNNNNYSVHYAITISALPVDKYVLCSYKNIKQKSPSYHSQVTTDNECLKYEDISTIKKKEV